MRDYFYDESADEEIEFVEDEHELEEPYDDNEGWHNIQNDYDRKVYGDNLP